MNIQRRTRKGPHKLSVLLNVLNDQLHLKRLSGLNRDDQS